MISVSANQSGSDSSTVWTVGHSTRPIEEFLEILQNAAITAVADVRRFPGSRRYPHYNQQPLTDSLAAAGTQYVWLPSWADGVEGSRIRVTQRGAMRRSVRTPTIWIPMSLPKAWLV